MESNRSVLQCPECQKALVNIGSRVERIHPIPRFINQNYTNIVGAWALVSIVGLIVVPLLFGGLYWGRFLGFALVGSILTPSIVMFFLVRCFPVYRITDCPYCGFHEKQKLGLSESAEL